MDIKSCADRPLCEIIRAGDELILSRWDQHIYPGWGLWPELGPEGEFQNWFVIARPRHPILMRVINRVINMIKLYRYSPLNVGKQAVIRTTGPIPYTLAIEPILYHHKHRVINSEHEGLMYSSCAEPSSALKHVNLFKNHYSLSKEPLILDAIA